MVRAALKECTRDRDPLNSALAENNLGLTLASLGERGTGTARLLEAVAAYETALEELTPERAPFYWARTKINLGFALMLLAAREVSTERLEKAVDAFLEALEVCTPDSDPVNYARAQAYLQAALNEEETMEGEQSSNQVPAEGQGEG